jgi:hypothetical protein
MRCVYCTLAISLLVGCQNQAVPVTNPFMPPDRVPPPATRTPAPGAAQPYYPGDPIPQLQPNAVVPQNYPPSNGYPPVTPGTPVVPPGNWNPQPPTSRTVTPSNFQVTPVSAEGPLDQFASVNEPAVQIQGDNQNLRFNSAAIQTLANVEPIVQQQSVVPAQFENVLPTPQFEQQPLSPAVVNVVPREVTIREIRSPSSDNVTNSSGFQSPSRDGFRPQGSRRRGDTGSTASEAVERFGFDPQYGWIRGQLEFEPTSQQWQLRYVSQNGIADQFGGRLLIANPGVLGDLQPGAYVQLQGQLGSQPTGPSTAVPIYSISAVQLQR